MQNPCTKLSVQGPVQPKHYRTVMLSQQQSSTDLHAVACNLGKLNAGAKIYCRVRFALSAGTADYLATCSYPLKCCSVPYATERIHNSLLHAYIQHAPLQKVICNCDILFVI